MEEILKLTNNILGEDINEEVFYQLINISKDIIEDQKNWMFLKKRVAITSNIQSLPTDFRAVDKVKLGPVTFSQVDMDEQDDYANVSNVFYIDYENNNIVILGTFTGTPYLYYIKTTPTITESVTPVWPERFWPRLAFDVAGYYQNGMDADDIYARMSTENKIQALTIRKTMEYWDSRNQVKAKNNTLGMMGTNDIGIDISQM